MDKLHGFSAVKMVVQAQPLGTVDGYGRNDAFGVGRNELFGAYKDANFTRGDQRRCRPTRRSASRTCGAWQRTSWFQWGVNTNSVIERNIGQALGVGATYPARQGFQQHGSSRQPPRDGGAAVQAHRARSGRRNCSARSIVRSAERGKKIFDRTCALCHETYTKTGTVNEYQLFALDVVGTDPSAGDQLRAHGHDRRRARNRSARRPSTSSRR